eukprot:g3703.t1
MIHARGSRQSQTEWDKKSNRLPPMSSLERRRLARRHVHAEKKRKAIELHKLQLKGFRSVAHKKRYDDRLARNPELAAPYVSWNDCKDYDTSSKQRNAASILQERTRNSEILELDYLHELNEIWLADQERAYVEKREDAVQAHQNKVGLMKEDFRARFWTLELECSSKQELRIEQKMLWERMDEDFEEVHTSHRNFLRDFDTDFESELRRFTQVIRRRTEDWIAHCRLHEYYSKLCQAEGVHVCTRYANELGHQNVSLRNYGLGAAETRVIAKTLANNSFIHTLDLTGNFIGDEGASALAEAIRGGKGMGMLTKSTAIEKEPGAGIGGMITLCSLRDLNVSKTNITSKGARYLLEACCIGKEQPRVSVSLNGDSEVDENAPANNVVEILDLSGNRILDDVSATLGAVLSSHLCGLRKLDISYNKLGVQSARAVAEALSVNRTLVQLSLRWNVLGEGGTDIATACIENDIIETLDLGFCALDDSCAEQFAEAIEEHDQIIQEVESMDGADDDVENKEGGEAMENQEEEESSENENRWVVVEEAKKASLRQLILDHNRITAAGAKPLLTALSSNTSLRVIDLAGNGNDIWPECQEEILTLRYGAEAVERSKDAEAHQSIVQNPSGKDTSNDANPDAKVSNEGKSTRMVQKQQALEHCTVGLDSGEVVQSVSGTFMQDTKDLYAKTRYAIAVGGVNEDMIWHESHETELTVSVDAIAMGQLRDAIARICQRDRRRQAREDSKIRANSENRNDSATSESVKRTPATPSDANVSMTSPVNHRVLETWLQNSAKVRTEIPHNAFPNELKIPVLARFTHHVSRNAMLAAESMGHENPKNVVCIDWPACCLPTGILLLAYDESKKLKTRLNRMLRIKRGRRLTMSIAEPATPARFHCHITRVSTNKGDGSRFCVTNSLELPYVLPAVEENRQVEHHEEEEEEDVGYGAESASEKKRKKDAESKAKRRVSWVERIALQKAKREQDAEEDRKRRIAMERRERGDDSDSNSHDKYGIREEDSSLETAEETESEETESESGISEQSKLHKNDEAGSSEEEGPLEVRRLELPSVLLTWEPSSKITGGRKLVQFALPMFFLAGLELDLGATIMMKEKIKKS